MMKKHLSFLLALCMVFSLLPFGASAASADCTHQMNDPDTGSAVSTISAISIPKDAEAKTPGVEAEVCWQCGQVISCTITPFVEKASDRCKEHLHPVTVVMQEAACEQAGLKITYCADCGSSIKGIQPQGIPGREHTLQFCVVQPPACGVDGWGYAVCTKCCKPFKAESLEKALSLASDSQQKEVTQLYQALKHNYRYVTTPVDFTGDGEINWNYAYGIHDLFPRIVPTHYQTVNGEKIVNADGAPVELFATGIHSYGTGYTGDKVCSYCGEVVFGSTQESLNEAHANSFAVIQTGYLPYIDENGNHIDGVTDTCFCQHCNKTIGGSVIPFDACPPADNTPPETMVVAIQAPTCTEPGYTGDTWKRATFSHNGETSEGWILIRKGEEIPPLGHDYQQLPDAPATCTNPGVSYVNGVYCARCGEIVYDREITYPATGHKWHAETLEDANCKNRGLDVLYCPQCGQYGEMFYTRPGNHAAIRVNCIEPTCTEPGYSGDEVCAVCGEFLASGYGLEPYGHDWSDWQMEEDPAESELSETRCCYRCGLTEERGIEPAPIVITEQPQDGYAIAGDYIGSVSVQAEGDDLSYRWQFSDNDGVTWKRSSVTSSFYVARLTPAKDGRMVRCIVTDRYGNSVISDAARLHVSNLAITSQPEDYYGPVNSTARFTVEAKGEGLQYRWFYSDDGENWNQSSVSSNRYSAKLTEAKDGRMLYCIVTDQYGCEVFSSLVSMNAIYPVRITAQPEDYVGALNSNATFYVEAEGDGLTYQWQISVNGGTKWSKSSVTTPVYSATLTSNKDGRMVRCIVTDQYGNTAVSEPATMSVSPILITAQPHSFYGPVGTSVTFSVEAVGEELTYQWQISDDGGHKWSKSSVTDAVYTTKLTAARNGRVVRCVITDVNGNSIISDAVKMVIQ